MHKYPNAFSPELNRYLFSSWRYNHSILLFAFKLQKSILFTILCVLKFSYLFCKNLAMYFQFNYLKFAHPEK